MEGFPLIWISHDLIRLFLPPKSASQLPTSFLLTPYFYNTPIHPHTSDIESQFFVLETSMYIKFGKKKKGAGYLRIPRLPLRIEVSLLRFITLILTIRRGSRWWSSMRWSGKVLIRV